VPLLKLRRRRVTATKKEGAAHHGAL